MPVVWVVVRLPEDVRVSLAKFNDLVLVSVSADPAMHVLIRETKHPVPEEDLIGLVQLDSKLVHHSSHAVAG